MQATAADLMCKHMQDNKRTFCTADLRTAGAGEGCIQGMPTVAARESTGGLLTQVIGKHFLHFCPPQPPAAAVAAASQRPDLSLPENRPCLWLLTHLAPAFEALQPWQL